MPPPIVNVRRTTTRERSSSCGAIRPAWVTRGRVVLVSLLLALLLLQGPGEGWNLAQAPPGEVKKLYWDQFETTEVWVLLLPDGPKEEPQPVNMVFQAFFSGRAKRDRSSAHPSWPMGKPDRLALRVQPFPLTVVTQLSLQLVVDDEAFDLAAPCASPGGAGPPECQLLFAGDGAANGFSVEIRPALLQRLANARVVTGTALGLPIVLSSDDLNIVREFAEAIHLHAVASK